jgi:hypothetical protein
MPTDDENEFKDVFGKISAHIMYHFAPIEQRESIEQNGLDSNLGRDPGDTTYNHAHGLIWALDTMQKLLKFLVTADGTAHFGYDVEKIHGLILRERPLAP